MRYHVHCGTTSILHRDLQDLANELQEAIEQAGYLMETLEHVARIDYIRRSLGSNELIPSSEVTRLEELRASMRAAQSEHRRG